MRLAVSGAGSTSKSGRHRVYLQGSLFYGLMENSVVLSECSFSILHTPKTGLLRGRLVDDQSAGCGCEPRIAVSVNSSQTSLVACCPLFRGMGDQFGLEYAAYLGSA